MDLAQVLSSHPCAIVAHPLGVESALIAVILAQKAKTTLQQAYIVTWNAEAAQRDLVTTTVKGINVLTYEQIAHLSNASHSLIVIDNAEQGVSLIGMATIQNLLKQHNIVLICFTMFTPNETLVKLRDALPGAYLTSATFADRGVEVSFELHTSTMTPTQDLVYQLKHAEELKHKTTNPLDIKTGITSVQIENLAYPPEIQTLLERKDALTPSPETIVGRYREQILDFAPKLRDLVMTIMLNREQRHIVFTRYAHHYGADVVGAVLRLYGLQVHILNHKLTVQQREMVMREFNARGQVLITSVMFNDVAPTNIGHLHMLDGGLANMVVLLNRCYKYSNYAKGVKPALIVDYYVCQRMNGTDAGGATQYRAAMASHTATITYWHRALKVARPIIVTDDGRLALTI